MISAPLPLTLPPHRKVCTGQTTLIPMMGRELRHNEPWPPARPPAPLQGVPNPYGRSPSPEWQEMPPTPSPTRPTDFVVTFTPEGVPVTRWFRSFSVLWASTAHPHGLWAALSWGRGRWLLLEAETSTKDVVPQREETPHPSHVTWPNPSPCHPWVPHSPGWQQLGDMGTAACPSPYRFLHHCRPVCHTGWQHP